MKSPPPGEAFSETLPVGPENLGGEPPGQDLFSLLLEIEAKLRAEARRESLLQTKSAKTRKMQKP